MGTSLSTLAKLRLAQQLWRQDRAQGWATLNRVFRTAPAPAALLDGFYAGRFVAINIAPGFSRLAEAIAGLWMPWKGKCFDAGRATGDNALTRDSYWPAHLVWPLYRGYRNSGPRLYHAFTFKTSFSPSIGAPDHQVLRLDYDVSGNPRLTVRRIIDELVQVDENYYLGRMVTHWWWGRWQVTAYFVLSERSE